MRMAFLALVLAGPALAATEADVDRLVRIAVGEYSNKLLVDAAKTNARPGVEISTPLRDAHHMFATEIQAPKLKGRVLYIEWRHDDAAGAISGQRVWTFNPTPDGVAMMFHTLKPSGKSILDGVTVADDKTIALTIDDLRPYPEACLIRFQPSGDGFAGENRSGQCSFPRTGAPEETFKVDAVLKFMPNLHSEQTRIWIGRADRPPAPPEDEEWIYRRIR